MVTFHVLSMICGGYPQVILYMAGISPFIADDLPMTGSFYDLFRLGWVELPSATMGSTAVCQVVHQLALSEIWLPLNHPKSMGLSTVYHQFSIVSPFKCSRYTLVSDRDTPHLNSEHLMQFCSDKSVDACSKMIQLLFTPSISFCSPDFWRGCYDLQPLSAGPGCLGLPLVIWYRCRRR